MTNATHTPGPWLLDIADHDAAIHAGGTIAMVDDTMALWRGNAALIAAAPDLLAAIKDIVAASDANDGDSLANAIQAARAAIAKARGMRLTDGQLFFDAASSVCDVDIFSDLDMETAGRIWRAIAKAKGK